MSRIRTNLITNRMANGAPTVSNGLVISGVTTSTTFSGSGASLTNLNASNIASGTVPTARLVSGTANSSTFLAGDSTFKTVTGTTINNNANNRIITGSGTANTLEGESTITYDNPTLEINTDTSPYAGLTLNGNSGGLIQFEDNEVSKWQIFGDSALNFYDDVNNASRLYINSSGFIGMGGNTNPTNVLHIKTAVTNTAVATIESTATNSYPLLRLKNDAREYQLTCHGGLSDAFTIYDGTSAAHRFTITSAGYVGINQTNPVRPLHITGNDGGSGATSGNSDTTIIVDNAGTNGSMIEFLNANNGAGHLMFTDTDGTNRGRISYHHNGDYFRFDTGGTERLRIDSNGFITQPGQCSFRATKSGGGYTHSTGTLVWDQNQHNTGSNYNTSNGRFTAPVTGVYIFHAYSIYTESASNDTWDFQKNGSNFAGGRVHFTNNGNSGTWDNVTNTCIISLVANDYITLRASGQGYHGGDWTAFCGSLLN